MTSFQFKSCFVFLLSITLTVSVTLYMSDTPFELSTVWIRNVAQQIHSYYKSIEVQTNKNDTLLNEYHRPRHRHRDKQWTPGTTDTGTDGRNASDTSLETVRYHEAYPRNYRFIIDEPRKCEEDDPFLILMVPVAPHELAARNAIRSTWGNESVVRGKTVTVVFSLGLPGIKAEKQQEELSLESQQYHDLVQSDFMDTYLNLTIKTMIIMDWLATRCPQASYAMKVDSDMFLNLENLMSLLLKQDTPRENYMTGMVMWSRPVVRDQNSKWYVPKELYPEDYYPTYLLGMGYVFSNDLPEKIVEASKDVKPFNIEDAYVGACLKRLGLAPSSPPDPSQFRAYFSGEYKREQFARVITTILSSPNQLITFWQDLKRPT